MLSEVSYSNISYLSYLYVHTYVYMEYVYMESEEWYKWTYLQNRNKLTNIENKLMDHQGSPYINVFSLRVLSLQIITRCW